MPDVSIRDLRNKGGEIVDRAARGEQVTITNAGRPVAELRPVRKPGLKAGALLDHWRGLPAVDTTWVRNDIDEVVDPTL